MLMRAIVEMAMNIMSRKYAAWLDAMATRHFMEVRITIGAFLEVFDEAIISGIGRCFLLSARYFSRAMALMRLPLTRDY